NELNTDSRALMGALIILVKTDVGLGLKRDWPLERLRTMIRAPTRLSSALPSPAQPIAAQPSSAQPSSAQLSPAQPSPAQPSPAQPSPAQPSPVRQPAAPLHPPYLPTARSSPAQSLTSKPLPIIRPPSLQQQPCSQQSGMPLLRHTAEFTPGTIQGFPLRAHVAERAATVAFIENLVKKYKELVAAKECPSQLEVLMEHTAHLQDTAEPVPIDIWYKSHVAPQRAWADITVLALHSMLRGVPLYFLDKGRHKKRPWYAQGPHNDRFGLSTEQVASLRPPGYKAGEDGEAMYLLMRNNNHFLVIGREDGTRLRDGELDLLEVAEEVLKISRQCDDEALRRLSPNSPYPHYLGTLEIDVAAARLTVEYGRERSFMICDIWMTCNLLKDDNNPVDYTRYARPSRHEDMWLKSRGFRQWSDVDALLLPLNISDQHWVLVVAYPKRGILVLWDSLPVGCTLLYTNSISMLTAHWTLVNTTSLTDMLVVHVSLVQKPGGLDVRRWDRIRRWCSGVLGVSEWRYIIGAVDQQRDGNTCGDRIILAMEHLCRDMYMTRLTITEAEVAKLRPTLLKTLRAESGWTTLVAPYKEEFPDFASLPPPGPYVPDPNPTMIDLCTQEEQMTLDQDVTILDSQGDPGQKQAAAVADAPIPASQDTEPIPDSQLHNPLKRPREPTEQTQAPSTGERPAHPAIAGTGYFGLLAVDDDEALPPKQASDDDSELPASEEQTHEEPVKANAVKGPRGKDRSRGKDRGRGRGSGSRARGGVKAKDRAKGTLNTAAEAVKGRAPRAKTGKEVRQRSCSIDSTNTMNAMAHINPCQPFHTLQAWDEANTPPLKPATVWRLPDFDTINPVVHDVDSDTLHLLGSRFPKLLWALLFLVIQFAEVIFKEGTFDDEGNMTDVGNRLGTDFGTGQRLQMSVTKSVKGKLSDSAKIAGLTSPWANSQWEAMKKEAGDKVELLTRRLHMAVEVATLYLRKLMPFIQKVAGGAIKGGTIIGNDPMHMRKVVYYGKTDKFAYAKHPAHRTVEAQVAHVDVAPNPLNDSASLKAELDRAKHDPKAIQRYRDGMVFIIAIQTFYLLLCEDSVEWVLVTEAHAEALWGEKSTDAQKAAYAAKLKGMPKLYIKRVKVEAGSCVCIRGYLLHAGDVGQPDTISVRIHFYSSLGFVSGTTTYVHSLSKEFCMNVMPTVQPRHGWPLVQEFDNYRNVMVPLPPYEPPKQQEYDLHYRPEWDMELPSHHIKGLEQAVSDAAAKAEAEARKEKEEHEVQVKAAKRARKCRETCLTTCDFLVLSIDSVSIYSHLPPRFLAALRGRRQPVMLMLTLEQRLGPYMTRCRVEGVIGFLGYCEAVQSVEIRLIMDEGTAEAPTYEQLPVGAWLAERLMSNFPNCQVLGIKPFLMQSSELLELLSHPLVVGRIQHLDIQTVNLTARERVVLDAWVEPALGLTSLHATYLGPLPMSLRDRTCNLVELKVTEMYLTDIGNLPQSVSTLLVSALDVVLPEPNMAALNRSVADLSSGRFKHQDIGVLFMGIVRKEGCASVAALQPLVGRFRKALVQVGEPGNDGKQVVQCDVVQAVIPMLKGVEIRFIYKQQAMEEAPTYAQLPVGAWLAERLMANFPQCLSLRLRGLQCAHPELAELLSHSQFMGRLQQLDIQQLHIQHGSVLDGHYEWVKAYLGLTTLSTVYLGPVPTSLQTCPSRLVKLSVIEMYLTAISHMPESIEILHISHLHVALPEPHQQALTNGVTALSPGRFSTLEIENRPKTLGDMPYEILASIAKSVTALPIAHRFSRCSRDTLTACLSTCKTLVLYIDAYSGFLRLSAAEAFRTRAEPVVLVLKRRDYWPQSDFASRLGKLAGDLGTCLAVHTVHITGELGAYDVIRNTELQSWQDLLSTSLPNCTALKVKSKAINIQHVTRLLSHSAIAQRLTHLDITTDSWTGDNNSGLSAFVKSTLNLRSLHVPTLDDLEDSHAEQVSLWDTLRVDTMHWATLSKLPALNGLVSIHIKRLDGSWGGEDESMEGFYAAHASHQLVVDELRMSVGSYPPEVVAALNPLQGCFKKVHLECGSSVYHSPVAASDLAALAGFGGMCTWLNIEFAHITSSVQLWKAILVGLPSLRNVWLKKCVGCHYDDVALHMQQVVEEEACNQVAIYIDITYIGGGERFMEDVGPLRVEWRTYII
ncbi:hypothetical protein QJQ45_022611, partial [Haematococcus lacustris]